MPALGANPYVYDIFVETDFMDGETSTDPDKIPAAGTWAIIESAFANSPLINLQFGYQGIQLHIDRGQFLLVETAAMVTSKRMFPHREP